MNTRTILLALLLTVAVILPGRAGEVHDVQTNYRGWVLAPWAPVVTPASITNETGGAFPATGTWHYALAAENSLGISGAGGVTNVTVATGNLVRITWRPAGGATNYLIYRGTAATSLTERAVVGLSTSYVDRGTNAWTTNSPASTITNVPMFLLGRAGVEANEAVTKAQLDAVVSPTGSINTLTATDSTAVVTGSGTSRNISVAAYVGGIRTELLATNAVTLGVATSALANAADAATSATQAQAQASALAAIALTNSGFTINGQAVTNGGGYSATDTNAVQRGGDTNLSGAYAHRGGATWTFHGGATGTYPFVILDASSSLSQPALSMARASGVSATLTVDTNAATIGTWGSLARHVGASDLATIWDSANDGALSALDAGHLGGYPAASYVLLSTIGNVSRYTNFPATATDAGAAGQWAVTNVGSTNWLAVWGVDFQGTGTNGWGFTQLQRARP